jgi:4-hydroxy-tetrahydrodipicolinate synthase
VTERPAGTIPALLTPFTTRGEVDLGLLDAHVAWLHERGVRTVSPLGTTGEGPSLALAERKQVIERLAAHPSELALICGTGCTALPETIELSRFAVERGAQILVAPPWYYDPFDERGVTEYFTRVLGTLPPSARVFLYHIPRQTGVPIADETLRALAGRFGPMLAGVKDSGGDFEHTRAWLRDFPELTVLSGSDATAAAAYEAGGRGVLTMLGNIFPEELEQIRQGVAVEERQRFLAAARELVQEVPRHAALKQLLHLVSGLPHSAVRPPLQELDEEQSRYFSARFNELRSETHV